MANETILTCSKICRPDEFKIGHCPVAHDNGGNCNNAGNGSRGNTGYAMTEIAAAGNNRPNSHHDAAAKHGEELSNRWDLPGKFLAGLGAQKGAEWH